MSVAPCYISLDDVHVSYFVRHAGRLGASAVPNREAVLGAEMERRSGFVEIKSLRGVTLDVPDGARVGLVGVNGAGKSTLLKLCAGGLSAQSGTIRIAGQVNPQFSLSSGMRPGLTGRQNARLKCLYYDIPHEQVAEQIERIREMSGLEDYFDLPLRVYSAGMRSRLAMSVLGLLRGDIVIMDEWISAADASINTLASQLQSQLIDSARILLMASHSEGVLRKWSDRLVWLHKGEIRAAGSHDEVLGEYRRFVESMDKSGKK